MQYFKKNVQVAELYHVSESAVRNWIEAARVGRLDLSLHENVGRFYIANTPQNKIVMGQLAERGKKFRNQAHHKIVAPLPEFYKLYTPAQVADIASGIDNYREVPLKYSYVDGGAALWDKHVRMQQKEPVLDMLTGTVNLLNLSENYIDELIGDSRRVNVIDLGPGNAMPIKALLTHLLDKGILGRYIGIDLSEAILDIAERNLIQWFGDRVKMERYARDIEAEQFNDLLVSEQFGHSADKPVNLVLLLGGTATNFREPFEALYMIRRSMGKNDLLIYNVALIHKTTPYFQMGPDSEKLVTLPPRHKLLPDWLNIDPSCYDVVQSADEKRKFRYMHIRTNVALSLRFEVGHDMHVIEIAKGERILVWRAMYLDPFYLTNQLDASGFNVRHTGTTKGGEFFLAIASIKVAH